MRDISSPSVLHPSFSGARIPTTPPEDPWWERVVWSVSSACRLTAPLLCCRSHRDWTQSPHVSEGRPSCLARLQLPPHGPLACDWSDSRGLSFFTQWCFGCSSGKRVSIVCSFLLLPTLKRRRTKRNAGLAPISNRLILGQSSHPMLVGSLPLIGGVLGQSDIHLGLELVAKVTVL